MNVTSPFPQESVNRETLGQWYKERAMGQALTEQLSDALNNRLEQVFGYHMLVTGADIGLDFSRLGKTQRIFCLATRPSAAPSFQPVVGMSSELPFASDSIDALVLCHTLNVSPTPHEVLRECQRVLVPNGHLFVVSFNPLSLWGLGQLANHFLRRKKLPAASSRKMRDWLALLGCSHGEPQYLAPLIPVGRGRLRAMMTAIEGWLRKRNAPIGNAYLIHARKRVSARLDSGLTIMDKPRLIAIPLGKSQGGVTVPRQVKVKIEDPWGPQQ